MTPRSSRLAAAGRSVTRTITGLTKLTGLVIAFNEAILRQQLRPFALAVAAFMMAGAQFTEGAILGFIERAFREPPPPAAPLPVPVQPPEAP